MGRMTSHIYGKQKMFQPFGNLSHNYGESPFLMGKSTISMVNHQFCHIKMIQTTNQKSHSHSQPHLLRRIGYACPGVPGGSRGLGT